MEQQLLNLYNELGIIDYTISIFLFAIFLHILHNIIMNLIQFIYEKAMFYHDKRKELKENGS